MPQSPIDPLERERRRLVFAVTLVGIVGGGVIFAGRCGRVFSHGTVVLVRL